MEYVTRALRALAGLFACVGLSGEIFALECPSVENAEKIADHRVIFVGELHGTNESPQFVGSLVCHLLRGGKYVALGMEIPGDFQSDIDAAMNEPDAKAARARLERMGFWDAKMQDGRRSLAWLELIQSAREMKREYPGLAIVAFDAPNGTPYAGRDAQMAGRIRSLVEGNPKVVVVALAGNVHTRRQKGTPWNKDFESAAYLLRDVDMVALDVNYVAGTAWNCTREGCGINAVSREAPTGRRQVPRIQLAAEKDGPYDGRYELGEITASLPVRTQPPSR